MTEYEMVEIVEFRLKREGWRVETEAPLWNCSIDIICERRGELWAIEAKLRDWRGAIEQARHHCIGADFSWVLLPERKRRPPLSPFEEAGVGLLFFEENSRCPFEVVYPAIKSDLVVPYARDKLLEHFGWKEKRCPLLAWVKAALEPPRGDTEER